MKKIDRKGGKHPPKKEALEVACLTALNHSQGGSQSMTDRESNLSQLARNRNHRLLVAGTVSGKIDAQRSRRAIAAYVPMMLAEGLDDGEIYLFMDFELYRQGHQLPPMLLAKELRRFGIEC